MRKRKRATVRDLRRDDRSVLLSSLYFGQPCRCRAMIRSLLSLP
jgi:hypothetical protein